MNESPQFKISFWRDYAPETKLLFSNQSLPKPHEFVDKNSGLQKEVYSWPMLEEAFGVIEDSLKRKRLTEALRRMQIDSNPNQHSLEVLKSFVEEARQILSTVDLDWITSQNQLPGEEENGRLNPLLALVNHLSWLLVVYDNQPNTAVRVK